MLYAHAKCVDYSKVSDLVLSTTEFWNIPDDDSSMVSVRSYVHCLMNALGYFEDTTGFNIDRILEDAKEIPYLKNTLFKRSVFEKCAFKKENNEPVDVWAFRGFRCLMDEIKKEKIMIFQ